MKYLKRLFLGVLVLLSTLTYAQDRTIVHEPIVWTQFKLKTKFNNQYAGSITAQHRAFLDRESVYHLYLSMVINRKLNYGFSLGAGFTSLNINRKVDTDFVLVPELRPFQSIAFAQPLGKSKFSWRFITEERFFKNAENGELVEGFNSNWRFRNKAAYKQFLSEKWNLTLSSEVMFNAGDNININLFDQHRFQFLFGYNAKIFSTDIGYMHWFVQTASNRHENRHTLVIAFTHSI